MIRHYKKIPIGKNKGKEGYCVVSHKTKGKILSCYLSKAGAEKAIERYARFRNQPGKGSKQSKVKIRKQAKKILTWKKRA